MLNADLGLGCNEWRRELLTQYPNRSIDLLPRFPALGHGQSIRSPQCGMQSVTDFRDAFTKMVNTGCNAVFRRVKDILRRRQPESDDDYSVLVVTSKLQLPIHSCSCSLLDMYHTCHQ
jgi:hypothetical protein